MSLILNIDTSTEKAFVALASDDNIIGISENVIQKDHASFLHPAIQSIMKNAGKQLAELDAVAVTAGPGSYTGIRVGMSTAKGLCFALDKPLIALNTLQVLARDAISNHPGGDDLLYSPMIDARRMEVYTAIYDKELKEIVPPAALVIEESFYRNFTIDFQIILFGSGASKCKELSVFDQAIFIENVNIPEAMVTLSSDRYACKAFTDLILSDPNYLKQFYNKV